MMRMFTSVSAAALMLAACAETSQDVGADDGSSAETAQAGAETQTLNANADAVGDIEGPTLAEIEAIEDPRTRMTQLQARAQTLQTQMRARFQEHIAPLQQDMQALNATMEATQAELAANAAEAAAPIIAEARACEGGDPAAPDFTPPEPEEGMGEAQANQMIEAALLEAAAAAECVYALPSGLLFRIDEVVTDETAPVAEPAEVVRVNYEGRLPNGEVFDSSYDRGEPISFPSNNVIQGWVQALAHMRVGEAWTLFIPAELGYGAQGRGPIGPDQAMIFTVDLLGLPNRGGDGAEDAASDEEAGQAEGSDG